MLAGRGVHKTNTIFFFFFLVTADIVGLDQNIVQYLSLKVLENALEKTEIKK